MTFYSFLSRLPDSLCTGFSGLDFTLTESQRAVRDAARRFAEEIRPGQERPETQKDLLREILQRLGELKMMGMIVPEAYGGAGKDHVSHVLGLIEVAKACPTSGAVMAANHAFYCFPLLTYGSHEQKNTYLQPCITGIKLGCYAFAEDEPDAEPSHVHTRAAGNSRGWLINGRKRSVGHGHIASYGIVLAMADGEGKDQSPSSLVMDLEKTPGFRVGKIEDSLDILASRKAEMIFENVQLPREALLGKRGEGMDHLKRVREESWMEIAGLAVGIGRGVLEKTLEWVRKGKRSGRPASSDQAVQRKLADMATELDAAELLTLRSAWLKDHGKPHEKEVAMARIFASDAAMRASAEGVQITGGCAGTPCLEKHMMDAKMCQLSMGANESAMAQVAKNLTKGK
jgi:alkylation response protein AidB-like acyl-CoA dehydrogenase